MPRGGKRPGSGRKNGSETKRTKARREAIIAAAAEGILPLEVILRAMRQHYEAGRIDRAAELAKDAAPYVHPRLASIQHGGGTTEERRLEITVEVVNGPPAGENAPGAG